VSQVRAGRRRKKRLAGQAQILQRYCAGLLQAPLLARQVSRTHASIGVIEFTNGSALQVGTNERRLIRALGDRGDRLGNPAFGALTARQRRPTRKWSPPPSLRWRCARTAGCSLGSSVYRRRGFMFCKWKELHGNAAAADICWLAPSRTMNSQLPRAMVDKALAEDAPRASAEFLSIWRTDMESFVSSEVVNACVSPGVRERPPQPDTRHFCFVDPSGGSGQDSFACAIGHRDGDSVVLDALHETRPPFSPEITIGRIQTLNVACTKCDRRGRYRVKTLVREIGLDGNVAN
jgi:hypothetical protein